MPNYKETTVSGEAYTRSFRIQVENKRGDTPHISFLEEEIITLGEREIATPTGQITEYFAPDEKFPLINPLDDKPLGADGSHAQLQVLLYSLYKYKALARDAAAAE